MTAQATRSISVGPLGNQVPQPSFTVSPTIGIVPVGARLDGSGSTDADGTITSYEWDFGDGTTGTGAIVTHTFDGAGPFVVSLKVTDNGGAENVFTQQLGYRTLAQVDVPVCGDQSDFNAVLRCADYTLKPGVDIWHVQGDGPVDVTFDWVYQNSGRNNQLSAFVVDDDEGAIDGVQPGEPGYQQRALARARNVFPLGSSSFSPDVTLPFTGGDRIAFYISRASNSEIANTSDPTLMLFSIGAANWDRLPHSVAFDRPGGPSQFGFEDLEGGGDGDFDDVVFTASGITTEVSQPPVARFTRTPASGAPPLAVQFDASTSSDDVGIASYAWSFGDGATSTESNPQHTYTTAGTYTVTLTVTDTDGETAQASSTVVVVVGNQPPTVDAGPDVTLVESNRTLIVFPTASDPDGQIASYEWDYGDGATSEGQVAVHTYATKGTFTATVTVTDDVGVTASDSLTVTIVNVDPVIGALDVPARALPGVALQMAAFVHDPGGLDTVAGSWDFGDGIVDRTGLRDDEHRVARVGRARHLHSDVAHRGRRRRFGRTDRAGTRPGGHHRRRAGRDRGRRSAGQLHTAVRRTSVLSGCRRVGLRRWHHCLRLLRHVRPADPAHVSRRWHVHGDGNDALQRRGRSSRSATRRAPSSPTARRRSAASRRVPSGRRRGDLVPGIRHRHRAR